MKHQWKVALLVAMSISSSAMAQERYMTIVRHGQGTHNIKHFYSSNPDHPNYRPAFLTELGKQQVSYTGNKLMIEGYHQRNIAAVIVSPLPRTVQTAKILAQSGLFKTDFFILDKNVIEVQAGDFEGQTYDPKTLDWNKPTIGTGEDRIALRCRMQAFYNKVVKQYPKGDIIVVTHGSPSMQLIDLLTDKQIKLRTADFVSIPITKKTLNKEKC